MSTNNYIVPQQNRQEDEASIDLMSILVMCLAKWRWFLLSVICCIGIAGLYLMRKTPVYTRTETILIKEDSKSGSAFSSVANSFDNLGLFGTSSNVYNEIAAVSSPSVIMETIRRLKIDYSYSEDGLLRDPVLYGTNLPYTVTVDGLATTTDAISRCSSTVSGTTLFPSLSSMASATKAMKRRWRAVSGFPSPLQ